jgi:hypothetical protein
LHASKREKNEKRRGKKENSEWIRYLERISLVNAMPVDAASPL